MPQERASAWIFPGIERQGAHGGGGRHPLGQRFDRWPSTAAASRG